MSTKSLLFNEKEIHFKKGTVIFKENDENDNKMYFIDSGMIKITKKVASDIEATLAILDTDDFFGEVSMITGNRRMASAIAHTDCKLHTMDHRTFETNMSNNKKFRRKIHEIIDTRLEETDFKLQLHYKKISRLTKAFNITG